ncbi:MAG TPA: alpha-2-macroglobulin family protein [Pyrinomonadaceae bacterium]
MTRLKTFVCLLLTLSIYLGAVAYPQTISISDTPAENDAAMNNETKGLQFRLSEGAEQAEPVPANKPAPAAALSDSETQNVLKRLPPVKAEATDEQDFALREKSLPPPRTGETIKASFPPPATQPLPDQKAAGALEVLRFSPEGEVPLAPNLSVTFSQPMVALTSVEELATQASPVQLSPQTPGRWRWVGTKTLLFEPENNRLPMATVYTVTVPAGIKSANGGSLTSARTWKFSTPPPQVKSMYPQGETQRRDVLMFVEFDQKVDPASALRTMKVEAGGATIKTRLATAEEVAADKTVSDLSKLATAGRWLAFRALNSDGTIENALPSDAPVTISVGPGTPSLEGSRTTEKAQSFSFKTFGPLRVTEYRCSYQEKCSPFDPWFITFSNPLDANAFAKSQLRVAPEIPGLKPTVYGNMIQLSGLMKGRTTYKLTLDASLRDSFGQTLGKAQTLTFIVGSAPPTLSSSHGNFVVLDPAASARYSVYSINYNSLKVKLYKVKPEDWPAFANYMRTAYGYYDEAARKQRTLPGRLVFNKTVPVTAKPDELVETRIDLSPALEDGFGQMILVVEPTTPVKRNDYDRQTVEAWVQSTNIGLDAFVDQNDLVGWATSLTDGRPLANVEMTIQPSGVKGQTGDDGLAHLALPASGKGLNVLVARIGRDLAILPQNTSWWSEESAWIKRDVKDELRWYVFDDRKMYRPGEEVHIKGWLRRIGGGTTGDVGMLNGAVTNVSYVLRDSRGNEITKGALSVNALGGFDTSFKLPGTMNLGYTQLELNAVGSITDGNQYQHTFQVQEFRRPEFEVKAQASDGPHFVGGSATATVSASYYAGGALPNAEVNWRVTSTPAYFTPPNRSDFTFGKWIPWWISYNASGGESHTETFKSHTDASGKHNLKLDFDSVNPPRPSNVTAEASVTDVNRQTWTAQTSMLVHPADLYVGLRSPRTFVQKGEPLVVESIVTDLDGKAIVNRDIKMRAVLLDWVYKNGEWKQEELSPQECDLKSASDAVKCTFTSNEGGTYRVTASIMDDRERRNESELTLWVAGGKQPPKRDVEQEKVELIPDRKEYQPGEVAEILVQAPFYPAEGILTLRRSGLVKTERFKMDGPSQTLKIPIEEGYLPNIYVQVDLNGAAPRADDSGQVDEKLPKRPAFASGSLNLSIPPASRKLNVEAAPRDKAIEPGGETVVNVQVKDAANRPVSNSEIAVVVVDESVLALSNYKLDDPLAVFYAQRPTDTTDYHLRENVMLANLLDLNLGSSVAGAGGGAREVVTVTKSQVAGGVLAGRAMKAPAPMASPVDNLAMLSSGESNEQIRVRENFNALAVFAASVPTDANGRAQVKVKLPDNLTRYRVMAVSVSDGKQFGSGESAITARMPLMARPSAPRFLNFGDKFELPVVLQNQTDEAMTVDVAVRATNAELTAGGGRRVTVPANDRVEVRFPTSANKAGTARFQIGAVAGRWSDAAEISLPVWTPATTEAFATYGEIDKGAIAQAVKAPPDVFKQFGGLEITTSSTQLQELTDAVLYLTSYPYECSEQLSSRVLAIAALKDVLTAFKTKDLPTPDELKASVARDLKRLQGMQNEDGGFGFWQRGDESWPYVSIHVAHALTRAKEKGFDVPDGMLQKSKVYLTEIEKHIPSYYSIESRRALIAYALNVRVRMGDRNAPRARMLIAEAGLDKLSLEAVGWLLPVLSGDANSRQEVEAIRRLLNNRATEDAGTAHFVTSYSDGEHLLLHSARRADGIILEALIGDQPQSDLIPKIVRGLLAHRTQGRWENTQENVFILLALDRYFATYEKTTPDFIARAWLGESYAGEHAFKGRTTERFNVNVPMRYLSDKQGTQNLVLSKEGAGRLYYRLGMQYAPTSLKLAPADYGFTVERVYEAVDNPADVRRDADGTWHIKAGVKVRVRLTMVTPTRRYHVALVDPLPAGLEPLNPALAVTGSVPRDEKDENAKRGWWWWQQWFEHQNMRDERVEAFTSLLWEGVYNYSYVARATTPGTFVVPPTKAEEMYHPETFGRGASDKVVVE